MSVVHCKRSKYDVYIGRPSPWGNPFKIGEDGTREEVIEKFRAWGRENGLDKRAREELKGKTLGCWCKPHACHGDVLAAWAKESEREAALNAFFELEAMLFFSKQGPESPEK